MDPAIIAVFGQPPENIDLSEDTASSDKSVIIAMLILALTFTTLRFAARAVQRSKPHWDDWVIILSMGLVGGTAGLAIAGGLRGAGKHVWAITIDDVQEIYKLLFLFTFLYSASCACIKISILLFYNRIFPTSDRVFRLSMILGYILSLSYPVVIWITMGNACRPLDHFWTQFTGAEGACIDINKFFLALGIINMINDFYILLIPIPHILKLQMSLRRKLGVTGIMMLGSFVCAASAVRIYYLGKLQHYTGHGGAMGPLFIWSDLEPCIAIVSACLPHMAPLRYVIRGKISSTFSGNSQGGAAALSGSRQWKDGASGPGAPVFTYGGTRYFGGGGGGDRLKLGDNDDEIELTSRVTAGSFAGKPPSTGSNSAENETGQQIYVHSTYTQTTEPRV